MFSLSYLLVSKRYLFALSRSWNFELSYYVLLQVGECSSIMLISIKSPSS